MLLILGRPSPYIMRGRVLFVKNNLAGGNNFETHYIDLPHIISI